MVGTLLQIGRQEAFERIRTIHRYEFPFSTFSGKTGMQELTRSAKSHSFVLLLFCRKCDLRTKQYSHQGHREFSKFPRECPDILWK